uniref:C2 domain-containing protein n=1 Tax=Zooxanthella nutricula TaxID=1333877 RepID=A0A7S2JYC4_9DINO
MDKKKRTPLLYAARYGRVYAVSRLLDAKASLKLMDREGRSALMLAACNAHYDTVHLLLRARASVNLEDQYYKTPLHGALETGNEEVSMLLLNAEADVNTYDCEGRTPTLLTMDHGNMRLFSSVVQRKANLDVLDKRGWNVVIYAIETGMLLEISPILRKLGSQAKLILRARDPQGRNSMHHAACLSSLAQAEAAIKVIGEMDPECSIYGDCNGDTSIHMAAELGRLDILRALLDDKESADRINNVGETPLHQSVHGGHLACVVALLRDRGRGKGPWCDASALDNSGKTILHHAAVSGNLDLVNLVVGSREGRGREIVLPSIDPNSADNSGATALMVAAREGQWQVLPSLFLGGANLIAKDKDGFTALHFAAVDDEPVSCSCLLDLSIAPDTPDSIGWTALMHASARGCDEAVRVLVDSTKCDLNARNWDGDTALQVCMRRTDPPELVQVTTNLLTDGILDNDLPTNSHIEAKGHFMISVLDSVDLYMEGKVGELNTYVCLQLRTHKGATPFVAFTTCVMKDPSPEWHETFRFDIDSLDSTAVLVAWVIAAPGDDEQDVIDGTELGLSEEDLRTVKQMAVQEGVRVGRRGKAEFTEALGKAFRRFHRRADRDEDREVMRLRKRALAESRGVEPTMDLQMGINQDSSALGARRWNEVANLRATLERSGCEIHEPLVPRTHLPLGCVVTRFRQLRTAVWETEPVQVYRTLRLNCRGNLRLEVDFRPQFFEPQMDARAKQLSPEEEDRIYTVGPFDVTHPSADDLIRPVPPPLKKKNGKGRSARSRTPKGTEASAQGAKRA